MGEKKRVGVGVGMGEGRVGESSSFRCAKLVHIVKLLMYAPILQLQLYSSHFTLFLS